MAPSMPQDTQSVCVWKCLHIRKDPSCAPRYTKNLAMTFWHSWSITLGPRSSEYIPCKMGRVSRMIYCWWSMKWYDPGQKQRLKRCMVWTYGITWPSSVSFPRDSMSLKLLLELLTTPLSSGQECPPICRWKPFYCRVLPTTLNRVDRGFPAKFLIFSSQFEARENVWSV